MGASGWSYFVPYQPDVGRALQSLREEIFRSGAYGKGFLRGEDIAPPEADTIDELLERVGADGTHSILDIDCTADEPDIGCASPAPERLHQQVFGSARPTHDEVEARPGNLTDKLHSGQAYYVIVYSGGKPAEIYFEGSSGD
jgi:hypothetical protein